MPESLDHIREAIRAGELSRARKLLTPLMKEKANNPEVWVLAARACTTPEQAILCLRKALALDAFHTEANRLLLKIEGSKPSEISKAVVTPEPITPRVVEALIGDDPYDYLPDTPDPEPAPITSTRQMPPAGAAAVPDPEPAKRRRRKERSLWRLIGCTGLVLLMLSFSLLVMNMAGLISGVISTATVLTGGPTPIGEWEGVPLEQIEDAPLILPAAVSEPAQQRDTDVLDHGYTHEYTFSALRGQQLAIYVQFMSLGANRVSRNVAILRPDGSDATRSCIQDRILQGDNNVTYICDINVDGIWRVRIVGRRGESVGAYFVGVEAVSGF